ncbi:SGNH/GDSL hydrolase family protein [Stigmatella hybrida]|uniref:SGNH/GDSL hydrolase family protein n=1 Tax=Stigmatella hybrida TaxID=394097 RepID=UPI001CDADF55|nr:SGNH/GDSL hydrolase family protein [Stigmatella hybrida]
MSLRLSVRDMSLACVATASLVSSSALASTINQNTSWTIKRTNATSTYRVVAYGDSIFAGYNGGLFSVARRASPYTSGEYLAHQWNANVEVVRRTKSGAKADDIYNNKIIGDRSYMQDAKTRVVMFEMCGNDYLQARSAFSEQTGTCNYSGLDTALANCTTYMERGMQAVNQYATSAKSKIIMNIYYPGYDADNVQTACTDASTGTAVNRQQKFLPYLAKSNWRTCNLAEKYGFKCADAFAEMMGSEYDSNGDGLNDVDGLRYKSGESEAAYVNRITTALRSTLRDANTHYVNSSTSFDYIQSDNTHPTYFNSSTISVNIFSGSGSGSGASDFADSAVSGGKQAEWNKTGHEKSGWSISTYNPATP